MRFKWLLFVLLFVGAVVLGAEAETVSPAAKVGASFVEIFGVTIAAVISGLVSIILALIAKKYHFEVDAATHAAIDAYLEKGVHAAEEWAAKSATAPSGNAKLDYAVATVRSLSQTPIVKNFTDEQLKKMVEAQLYKLINSKEPEPTALGG